MAMPAIIKTWSYLVNQRITFVSINATVGALLYGIFSAGLITAGAFTCVGSSTGVTGTGNLSGSNTWTSATVPVVRGASTSAVQSWIVVRDGNGWDWMICYQGAADNNIKVSVSPGQLWTLNGTNVAFQPTATDEVPVATNALDFASATATLDRVWHLQYSSDKKIWRAWVYRNSVMLSFLAGEEVNSAVVSFPFTPAVIGIVSTNSSSGQHAIGGVLGTTGTNGNATTRINATALTLGGSGEGFLASHNAVTFGIEQTNLQSASPVVPVGVCGITAGVRGKVGNRIDVWASYQNLAEQSSDMYESSTYTGMGSVGVYPWNGSVKSIA